MDIDEFFKENLKNMYVIVAVFLIAIVTVIYFVWVPEKNKMKNPDIIKYEEVSQDTMDNTVRTEYFQDLILSLRYNSAEELEEYLKIDSGYLEYRGLTSQELIQELARQGYLNDQTNISDITRYEVGDTFVYRGVLVNGNSTRDINIIETYPYEYTISFDSIYEYKSNVEEVEEDNVNYKITKGVKALTYVSYIITITNEENDFAIYNLNKPSMIYAVLNDGTKYNISVPTSNFEETTTVNKNSSITINTMFRIPLQNQDEISAIVFKDVQIDEEESDVAIGV